VAAAPGMWAPSGVTGGADGVFRNGAPGGRRCPRAGRDGPVRPYDL